MSTLKEKKKHFTPEFKLRSALFLEEKGNKKLTPTKKH